MFVDINPFMQNELMLNLCLYATHVHLKVLDLGARSKGSPPSPICSHFTSHNPMWQKLSL